MGKYVGSDRLQSEQLKEDEIDHLAVHAKGSTRQSGNRAQLSAEGKEIAEVATELVMLFQSNVLHIWKRRMSMCGNASA